MYSGTTASERGRYCFWGMPAAYPVVSGIARTVVTGAAATCVSRYSACDLAGKACTTCTMCV